ncbi:MAG: tetratricopeptide repeat protein [Anaerolineaceae bacterium]|nr:tetratricopeptide repeat protein [Anaerolineaceae bacterium]
MVKKSLFILVISLFIGVSALYAQDATPTPIPLPPPPVCPAFEGQPADIRAGYYMGEGIAYLNTNQLSSAELSFTCIIRVIDPAYFPAYMARGLTYIRLRDFARAQQDFNQAIQRQPDSVAAINNRGVVFALQFDYERAARDFDHALELDSGYLRAVNNRAIIYTLLGDYDAAITLLEDQVRATQISGVLEQYRDPDRPSDAGPILFDPLAGRLYALLGIVYSARSLDKYQDYIELESYANRFPDERISAASGALESRFTFELRLDDGSWLLLDEALTE